CARYDYVPYWYFDVW
nr:immunoglobulin heavy chain junction region [Mus musculus]NSM04861.1 immunoglobulin heavy chain junction region [Mus musculus]